MDPWPSPPFPQLKPGQVAFSPGNLHVLGAEFIGGEVPSEVKYPGVRVTAVSMITDRPPKSYREPRSLGNVVCHAILALPLVATTAPAIPA
jgi:hypothetical protein